MDFDLSDDQRMLKDSVDRLIADTYGFEQRRQTMASAEGWSRATWAQFADLGLLGVNFEEEFGGFGGGPVETMLVAEAFGRGLVVEPAQLPVARDTAAEARARARRRVRRRLPPPRREARPVLRSEGGAARRELPDGRVA